MVSSSILSMNKLDPVHKSSQNDWFTNHTDPALEFNSLTQFVFHCSNSSLEETVSE